MDLLKEPVNNLTDEQFYKAFEEAKIKYKKPTLQFSNFLVILVQNGIISMNKVVSLINYERNERK